MHTALKCKHDAYQFVRFSCRFYQFFPERINRDTMDLIHLPCLGHHLDPWVLGLTVSRRGEEVRFFLSYGFGVM
jgi:hypothetical protein